MFNIGGGEFLIIFLVALVVLGPAKLPDAARQAGKIIGEFRRVSSSFQREIQSAMKDPVSKVTGETTPRSLKDVTSVAKIPTLGEADSAKAANGPQPNVVETAAIAEMPESDVQAEEEPPDAPVMYGDR
jgi:sec-independent protein translocase protein TatB